MVTDSDENLSSLTRELGRLYETRRLKVNVEKSKVPKLSLSAKREPLSLRLSSEDLDSRGRVFK